MVGAGDGAHVPRAFQQHRHTVQAHIRHGADRAVTVTQHHDRLPGDLAGHIVAGVRQRAGPANADPFPGENAFLFAREELGRGIDRGWHRLGAVEGQRGGPREFDSCACGALVHSAARLLPFLSNQRVTAPSPSGRAGLPARSPRTRSESPADFLTKSSGPSQSKFR